MAEAEARAAEAEQANAAAEQRVAEAVDAANAAAREATEKVKLHMHKENQYIVEAHRRKMKEEHAAEMALVNQKAAVALAQVKIREETIAQYFALLKQGNGAAFGVNQLFDEFDPERGEPEPYAGSTPHSVSAASSESGGSGESGVSSETAGVPL
eukprot:3743413-Rhodomonas_salina.1